MPDLVQFLTARIDDDSAGARSERMRAEVRAKRRLIDLHTYASSGNAGHRQAHGPVDVDTLRIMAAVYADHPGYQPEWAFD